MAAVLDELCSRRSNELKNRPGQVLEKIVFGGSDDHRGAPDDGHPALLLGLKLTRPERPDRRQR
jgi:hypothetical protein